MASIIESFRVRFNNVENTEELKSRVKHIISLNGDAFFILHVKGVYYTKIGITITQGIKQQ